MCIVCILTQLVELLTLLKRIGSVSGHIQLFRCTFRRCDKIEWILIVLLRNQESRRQVIGFCIIQEWKFVSTAIHAIGFHISIHHARAAIVVPPCPKERHADMWYESFKPNTHILRDSWTTKAPQMVLTLLAISRPRARLKARRRVMNHLIRRKLSSKKSVGGAAGWPHSWLHGVCGFLDHSRPPRVAAWSAAAAGGGRHIIEFQPNYSATPPVRVWNVFCSRAEAAPRRGVTRPRKVMGKEGFIFIPPKPRETCLFWVRETVIAGWDNWIVGNCYGGWDMTIKTWK